jgi:hypothetical protein
MENVIIKATQDDKTLELSFPQDCDIHEWVEQLKLILVWATFSPDLIKEVLPEEFEEPSDNTN